MPSRARSLRFKLALWFVSVFFLIQVVLMGGVAFFRREVIRRSSDDSMTESASSMVDSILNAQTDWTEQLLRESLPVGSDFALAALRDEDGVVLASWNVADVEKLRFSQSESVSAGPIGGVHFTVSAERAEELAGEAHDLRVVTLPFRHGDRLYFFQAAVKDQLLESLLGPFFELVAIGVPVGVLAASIAAWIIAGRAVSPLHRLTKAAMDVSPKSLNERFKVSSTDQEIGRLEAELNSALERLEEGYRAQDQFISNVSHELRTPIAVLMTQAQVAKMGDRSVEKGYYFVESSERSMKRLGKIVESFLVLARADFTQGRPTDSVEMIDVVLGCVQSCQVLAEQHEVRLIPNFAGVDEASTGLVVSGDAELLQTMLENLVRNAISHSPPKSLVEIDAENSVNTVRLVVRDHGPGIPEEYLERVFDRYMRTPDGVSRRDGLGLGLAIANRIAKLHQGVITVANNEDSGCSFAVSLPKGCVPATS